MSVLSKLVLDSYQNYYLKQTLSFKHYAFHYFASLLQKNFGAQLLS